MLTQLLFIPVIVVVGQFGEIASVKPNVMAEVALYSLLGLSVANGVVWVYRLRDVRWLAVSLVIAQEILVVGAVIVAGMAITGDWL